MSKPIRGLKRCRTDHLWTQAGDCCRGNEKIVESVYDAILRTRKIAAPLDAKRLEKETPCTKLGKCIDCHHSQRICNDFVLITGQFEKERIKIIFIEGDYGY